MPCHVWKVQIEQHKDVLLRTHFTRSDRTEQKFRALPFRWRKRINSLLTPGAANIALDETRVPLVILDHDDGDRPTL